ncbi:MAG: hypothetical protein OXC93_11435 [Rhodospirillaceae bacterium]|nr:hypothetical protein [Rhodospirillaceae bacterium]
MISSADLGPVEWRQLLVAGLQIAADRRRRNDCNLSSRLRVSTYSALLVVDEIGYLPVS